MSTNILRQLSWFSYPVFSKDIDNITEIIDYTNFFTWYFWKELFSQKDGEVYDVAIICEFKWISNKIIIVFGNF